MILTASLLQTEHLQVRIVSSINRSVMWLFEHLNSKIRLMRLSPHKIVHTLLYDLKPDQEYLADLYGKIDCCYL